MNFFEKGRFASTMNFLHNTSKAKFIIVFFMKTHGQSFSTKRAECKKTVLGGKKWRRGRTKEKSAGNGEIKINVRKKASEPDFTSRFITLFEHFRARGLSYSPVLTAKSFLPSRIKIARIKTKWPE